MGKIVISGASGFIGSALAADLHARGNEVVRLVRRRPSGSGEASWDPSATPPTIDSGAIEGAHAVVHLAGVGIADHRWSKAHKEAVLSSRVRGTTLLAHTIATVADKPNVFVSGSAVGYYGNRGDTELDETATKGTGFLADVCAQWEEAASEAWSAGVRVVLLRTGVVLSASGGALRKQLLPFKLGLGGRLGDGRQYLPWITLNDELAAIRHVIDHDQVDGPVNLTAPVAVTNREFTRALGAALRRPTVLPTPLFALRARFGPEMVSEMLLASQRVVPTKLMASGFTFAHPELSGALSTLVRDTNTNTKANTNNPHDTTHG